MLIGHQELVKDFNNLVKSNRLAHGYIFFGEPEVGKFYFAKHLAHLVEQGEPFDSACLPSRLAQDKFAVTGRPLQDALVLENNSAATSENSGIDAMREVKNFLWQKPNVSGKRTVIINNADRLTPQAQNAILKISEEPPENALVILIVNQVENLLPPLLSRLQKIYFHRLTDAEMEAGGIDQKIIPFAFGRPGRAARLSGDDATKTAGGYARDFLRLLGPERSKLIKELVDLQKEKPELLDLFFESVIALLRHDLVRNAGILRDVLHRLFLIKSYNTNKRLQLEAI